MALTDDGALVEVACYTLKECFGVLALVAIAPFVPLVCVLFSFDEAVLTLDLDRILGFRTICDGDILGYLHVTCESPSDFGR